MRGKPLKRFADTLPQDEKEALYALCEPDWSYEVVGIKKGDDGIMMPIAFYWCLGHMAPLYKDGEIRWLFSYCHLPEVMFQDCYSQDFRSPEEEAIMKKYDDLESKYTDSMRPYPWQKEMFCNQIREPIQWCLQWLLLHDPREIYYSDALWDERSVVLDYLKELVQSEGEQRILGKNLQKELKVTKESVQEIQVQLKMLDEYEKQLRTRKKDD